MPTPEEEIVSLPAQEAAARVRRIRDSGDWTKGDRLTTAYWKAHHVNLDDITRATGNTTQPAPGPAAGMRPPGEAPSGVQGLGVSFMLLGLVLFAIGFMLPSAVETSSVASSFGLESLEVPSFPVNNLGRLNTKMMLVVTGAAFWVGGCVFAVQRRSNK